MPGHIYHAGRPDEACGSNAIGRSACSWHVLLTGYTTVTLTHGGRPSGIQSSNGCIAMPGHRGASSAKTRQTSYRQARVNRQACSRWVHASALVGYLQHATRCMLHVQVLVNLDPCCASPLLPVAPLGTCPCSIAGTRPGMVPWDWDQLPGAPTVRARPAGALHQRSKAACEGPLALCPAPGSSP